MHRYFFPSLAMHLSFTVETVHCLAEGNCTCLMWTGEVHAFKTALGLVAGEKGMGRMGKPLSFKGSSFHRVIPDFMCQGRAPYPSQTSISLTYA